MGIGGADKEARRAASLAVTAIDTEFIAYVETCHMKTISRTLRMLAATALSATVLLSQAVAAPIVSIQPTDQTIQVGDPASIDIIVSGLDGLTGPVGGFAFDLVFNGVVLTGVAYTNDPDGKMGAAPLDLSGGFAGGTLNIFFVADVNETEASLAASQGAGFRLATVEFMGAVNGLSNLTLTNVDLSNWDGTQTLAGVGVENGRICVGGNCAVVPEPATLLLFGSALGGLAIIRRRRQSA